jgi:hypothetical protein
MAAEQFYMLVGYMLVEINNETAFHESKEQSNDFIKTSYITHARTSTLMFLSRQ